MINYQTVDFLKSQLREQYDRSGYSYEKPSDVDRILEAQAAKLAASGVSSIYDIGLKEIPNQNTISGVFRVGEDFYYRQEEDEGPGYDVKIDPSKILDLAPDTPVREDTEGGEPIFQDRFRVTVAEDPTKYLINKQTGQEIPKVGLKSNWKEDPTAFNISKPEPIVSRNGYERYGFDTSVEGQADYSVQFVDGKPIFLPAYKSTKTDLTPYLAIAAVIAAPYIFGPTAAGAAGAETAAAAGAEAGAAASTTAATNTAIVGTPGVSTVYPVAAPSIGVSTLAPQVAGTTGGLLAADAASVGADAAQLYAQTGNVAAVQQNLIAAGVDPIMAAEAANLAAYGGTSSSIGSTLASTFPGETVFTSQGLLSGGSTLDPFAKDIAGITSTSGNSIGLTDALRAANSINNLLNRPTIQQQAGLLGGGGGQARGVDFSPLYQNTIVGLLPSAELFRRSLI